MSIAGRLMSAVKAAMMNQMANSGTASAPSDSNDNPLPLEAVLTTSELERRGRRVPDYAAENRALTSLLETVSSSGDVLEKLAETALSLCAAHSAGVSLLQQSDEGMVFRWRAVAGQWARFVGGTMPRGASPCGEVLDQNCTLLFNHPERHYPIAELLPAVSEVLLIPFHVSGEPAGTIWVIAHDESRRFDLEDERLMTSLGRFASTACHLLETQAEVRASGIENARLYAEAIDANRARDEFFAALSHELRTPLTAVLGWAALLARHPDRESAVEAARAIMSAATLQAQLVDDLLDVSRIMTGKFAILKANVDLNALVEDALTSFRPTAAAKKVSLRPELSGPIMMSGDPTRLRQVMSNLLSNAIKFTSNGGLIATRLKREGSEAILSVSDTGEGIPQQFLPHVFERYAQLGERRLGGMGLGLAIVKHIVDLHGGSVSAESAGEGKGSTFTVRLPVVEDDVQFS